MQAFVFRSSPIDLALLLMRVVASAFMLTHGIPKIMRLFGSEPIRFADPFGLGPIASLALAAFAEGLCSVLIILGIAVRFGSLMIVITMIVAAFHVHGSDPFAKKELPLLYALVFSTLVLTGGGRYVMFANAGRNRLK